MKMQADILNRFGVPINVAEGQLDSRMKESSGAFAGEPHPAC
jgi:hypothetical protein